MHAVLVILHIVWVIGITKYVGLTETELKHTTIPKAQLRAFLWPLWMLWHGLTAIGIIIMYLKFKFESKVGGNLF